MKFKRILSFLLCFVFALSVFPQITFANGRDIPERQRQVYLHVQGEEYENPPADNPKSRTTVYLNEQADVFFAVDNPNKGTELDASGNLVLDSNGRPIHKYPQYEMNGYRIKICFDDYYFDFINGYDYNTNPNIPISYIDYEYPNKYKEESALNIPATDFAPTDVPDMPNKFNKEVINGKEYITATIIVFFNQTYLPPKPENINWYDILRLPLLPTRAGYTKVFIDVDGITNYNDRLQLFAKDVSGNREDQTFDLDVLYNGVMEIDIRDRDKPLPPVAISEINANTSTKPFNVTLDCDEKINGEPCCHIWYYLNDDISTLKEYTWDKDITKTEKININTSTKISCYAVRKSDSSKVSITENYTYTIVPPMPYLFDEGKELIPNYYNEDDSYNVYVAVGDKYEPIPQNNAVYYTYANLDETAEFDNNNTTNAETKWARLDNNNPKIKIDENRTIRLITVGKNEKSEIAEYNLGIISAPSVNTVKAPVFAPESAQFTKTTDSVTIYCEDSFFESIGMSTNTNTGDYTLLYTTNGSDPRTHGTEADLQTDMVRIGINKNTEIKAVVKKGDLYSDVITHRYEIRTEKPVKPLATLSSGTYTKSFENEGYSVKFAHVPDGITIYYVTSNDGKYLEAPEISEQTKYTGQAIELKGNTQIKAIAVNKYNVKSDVAAFNYIITPEAPKSAPTARVQTLPVIPVWSVPKSDIAYEINNNRFTIGKAYNAAGFFYINTATGKAYADKECTILISDGTGQSFTDKAEVEITSTLNGITSPASKCIYELAESDYLASPYADKATGVYEETGSGADLTVNLYAFDNATIEYRTKSLISGGDYGEWQTGSSIDISEDTAIELKAALNGVTSDVVNYEYKFKPVAPTFDNNYPCGYYGRGASLSINQNTSDTDNDLWYRESVITFTEDFQYTGQTYPITETTSYRAYNRSKINGEMSDAAFCYYIIEPDNMLTGDVTILPPYDKKIICTEDLGTGEYLKGIKLYTANKDAEIRYFYSYTLTDGTAYPNSNVKEYDDATPIRPHGFYDINITAWLVKKSDNSEIEGSRNTFHIDFIAIPKAVQSDKTYTVKNDYPTDDRTVIYYTLDNTSPADDTNTERKIYNGETFNISQNPKIKTVYFRACGTCGDCNGGNVADCAKGIYGRVGTYSFSTSAGGSSGGGGGGGGGGGTIDKTRKYTKDIFGTEHPTHIGYINGYPDGSVQPDGNITREEIAAILYRVKYKAYDEPFIATGDVFPDVAASRWSVSEIEFMTDKGVIYGYPDGEFKPSRNLTRAEFAALIRRFTGLSKPSDKNIYPDLDETHWAYEDIMILTEAGLLQGYEDGTIRPQREISRAEVMTVVNKILGRCPDESYVKGLDFNPFNDLNKDAWHYVTVLEATITHDYYLNSKETLEIKWENWK